MSDRDDEIVGVISDQLQDCLRAAGTDQIAIEVYDSLRESGYVVLPEVEHKSLLGAVKAVRNSDCGAWLKDCQTGLFSCWDGSEKRQELARLLDRLYTAANTDTAPDGEEE